MSYLTTQRAHLQLCYLELHAYDLTGARALWIPVCEDGFRKVKDDRGEDAWH